MLSCNPLAWLQQVDVPIVATSTCNGKSSYNGEILSTMFCAGEQDTVFLCNKHGLLGLHFDWSLCSQSNLAACSAAHQLLEGVQSVSVWQQKGYKFCCSATVHELPVFHPLQAQCQEGRTAVREVSEPWPAG